MSTYLTLFLSPCPKGESGPPAILTPGIPVAFLPLLLPCPAPEGVHCQWDGPTEGA